MPLTIHRKYRKIDLAKQRQRECRVETGWRVDLAGKLRAAERLVILGVGNSRRGDDAAGGLVVRQLLKKLGSQKEPGICLLDGGEVPESLTGEIRKFGPSHVLIVDTASGGYEPGTIFLVDREKISQDDLTTHRIPLSLLVRYLEESVGCRVLIIGIEPCLLGLGEPLSDAVTKAVRLLSKRLAEILKI